MFTRCLLGSLLIHIIVVAGIGASVHQAPLRVEKITYFQLVGIDTADFGTGPGGFQTVNWPGILPAAKQPDFHPDRSGPPLTALAPAVRKITVPDIIKPEPPAREEVKPVTDISPGISPSEPGTSIATNPGDSSAVAHPGMDFEATNSGDPDIAGNGAPVIPPRRIYAPAPEYPLIARRNNWEGLVILRILVKTDGTIGAITVFQSSGFEVLDQSALKTVRTKWRYQPALRRGVAVEVYIRVPVRFKLEE